jgi:hypothetical protein
MLTINSYYALDYGGATVNALIELLERLLKGGIEKFGG